MSDLVGSPEDRFSHNEAQTLASVAEQAGFSHLVGDTPMQRSVSLTPGNIDRFQMKNCDIFS